MNRNPPQEVKKILRQEVRFACPIPNCSNPVLTWHHFDPPWHDKQHHNPEGMIALCTLHHPLADGENWTRSQLRSFKQNPPTLESIRKKFLWSDSKIIYRLGGSYAANCDYILTISGIPIIWNSFSNDGRILFYLDIRNEENSQILFMEENFLSIEYNKIEDLTINTHENHFKVWFAEREIGLELRLRHLSLNELAVLLEKDSTNSFSSLANTKFPLRDILGTMPKPDLSFFLDYAQKECLNSDKKIAILDFLNATLFGNGKRVVIRDGISAGTIFKFSFSYDNGGAAFAL